MPPGVRSYYADGRNAFKSGKPLTSCPCDGVDRAMWRWGWLQAADDVHGPPNDGVPRASTVLALAAKSEALNGAAVRSKSRWA